MLSHLTCNVISPAKSTAIRLHWKGESETPSYAPLIIIIVLIDRWCSAVAAATERRLNPVPVNPCKICRRARSSLLHTVSTHSSVSSQLQGFLVVYQQPWCNSSCLNNEHSMSTSSRILDRLVSAGFKHLRALKSSFMVLEALVPDIRGASLSSSEESNQAKEDLNGLLWTANNTS